MNIYWYRVFFKEGGYDHYYVIAETRSRGLSLVRQHLAEDDIHIDSSISQLLRKDITNTYEGILH